MTFRLSMGMEFHERRGLSNFVFYHEVMRNERNNM